MDIADYIAGLTGKTVQQLFGGSSPLVVVLREGDTHRIAHWDASLGEQVPTSEQLDAIATAPMSQAALVAYANSTQWALVVGGKAVTIGGRTITFSTTPESMTLMNGVAARQSRPNPPATINWQIGPTEFVALAATDFLAAATTVSDWVQALFDALPPIFAGIADGSIITTAQIDAALAAVG
ncbi:hypothetical protein [Rhodopseudomonas palustris]|uniref:DUF4376 domain-containing protein n=1 Tax=Rhodopseudomonas palustris TaxID=1076 RepID=UPI000CEBB973|nr:hypothetical protein [Rhodopseudomonas palustris]PPQ42177.1 hypothetical protein CKO39_18475 [Rhodopseudomonas palustris]